MRPGTDPHRGTRAVREPRRRRARARARREGRGHRERSAGSARQRIARRRWPTCWARPASSAVAGATPS